MAKVLGMFWLASQGGAVTVCLYKRSWKVDLQAMEVWDSCIFDNSHCGEMVPNSFCPALGAWLLSNVWVVPAGPGSRFAQAR